MAAVRAAAWLVVLAVGGLLAVLAFAVSVVLPSGYQPGGPLESPRETEVRFPIAPDQVGTWGTVLPVNRTAVDIVLESVEPVSPPEGLEVLGVSISDPDADGGVGTFVGYPAPGIASWPVAGAELPPAGAAAPHRQVLIGVRLIDPMREGRIEGLRIRYAHGGTRYETLLRDALTLRPQSSP